MILELQPNIPLSASSKFVWELYITFNEIVKATYIRSRAAYRLKIIARARSINDRFLALVRMLVTMLRYTYARCNIIPCV